jgi:SAM-dependent methyltransferase
VSMIKQTVGLLLFLSGVSNSIPSPSVKSSIQTDGYSSFAFVQTLQKSCSPSRESAGTYKGRIIAPVMSVAGADWLTREDREKHEQPDKVLDALCIREGMTVADVGAGVGYFSLRLARRVKNDGKVLAVDIQGEMLDLLRKNMENDHLSNIDLILGTPTDPRLPAGAVDLALLVDVYHEFQYPDEMMSRIRASLAPEGRVVLIEYRGEDPEVPIKAEHKMTVDQVLFELEPMGFRLEEKLEFLPWQHVLIFKRANLIGH